MLWAAGFNVSSEGTAIPVNPNPAQVLNLSWGSSGDCSKAEQDTINTINAVTQNGTIIVVAAGNSSENVSNASPANCNGVISVAAKGPTNKLAYYSNFGATTIAASGGDYRIAGCHVDSAGILVCPSTIYSTIWSSLHEYQPESLGGFPTFAYYQGTSMAAAWHVVAAIADIISVVKSKHENYTLPGIISVLNKTAIPYDNCNIHGCAQGGTIDVKAAVMYAMQHGG